MQLVQLLMRQRETQPVFTHTAEDFRHARRDEVVKFVNVEPEVLAVGSLLAMPRHRQLLKLRHEQGAEQVAVLFPATFRQPGQKDFAAIHDVREVEPVLRLANHIAQRLSGKKILQPGQHRADGFIAGQLREHLFPKEHHFRVIHRCQKFFLKAGALGVQQEQAEIGQRATPGALQHGEDGILQHSVHLVAPRRGQPAEHGDEVGREQLFFLVGMRLKNIEPNWKIHVRRIHQHHVVNPVIGDHTQNLFDQIAVGIQHRHAVAVRDVLLDEIEQQGRFAGAGGTDDVGVAHPLLRSEIHRHTVAVMFVVANDHAWWLPHKHWRSLGQSGIPQQRRRTNGAGRQMHEADQFFAVQDHARPPGTPADHIFQMRQIRIVIVADRDE